MLYYPRTLRNTNVLETGNYITLLTLTVLYYTLVPVVYKHIYD